MVVPNMHTLKIGRFCTSFNQWNVCKGGNNEDKIGQTDHIMLYTLPKEGNEVSTKNVPDSFFDLSRKSIKQKSLATILRKSIKTKRKQLCRQRLYIAELRGLREELITAQSLPQRHILVFSYHAWTADEIKYYLL